MMVTDDKLAAARRRFRRVLLLSAVVGLVVVAELGLPAAYLSSLTASGDARDPVTAIWLLALLAPVIVLLV